MNERQTVNESQTVVLELAWIGVILLIASVICGILVGFSKKSTFLIYVFNFGLAPVMAAAALVLIRKYPNAARLVPFGAVATAKTFVILLLVGLLGMAPLSYLVAPNALPKATPIFLVALSVVVAATLNFLPNIRSMLRTAVAFTPTIRANVRSMSRAVAATFSAIVAVMLNGLAKLKTAIVTVAFLLSLWPVFSYLDRVAEQRIKQLQTVLQST